MASFVNANLGSDSESDDSDFDPTKEAGHEGVSEEEVSGDDENPNNAGKKSKKKVKKSDSKRSGGCFQEETAKDEESEKMKLEFQKEQEEIKEQNEKKKNDDIWSGKKKIRTQQVVYSCPLNSVPHSLHQFLLNRRFSNLSLHFRTKCSDLLWFSLPILRGSFQRHQVVKKTLFLLLLNQFLKNDSPL